MDDVTVISPLLATVYDALGLAFDSASVGSVRAEAPTVSIDVVEAALISAYDDRFTLIDSAWDPAVLAVAGETVADHRA